MNEKARRAFVDQLRARRIELGLRQRDVGNALFVDNMTVSRWEAHKRVPDVEVAGRWAEVLDVRVIDGVLERLFPSSRAQCGTTRGYKQHRRHGERCPACWRAWADYNAAAYAHRPRKIDRHRAAVIRLMARGLSAAAISRHLGVPGSTARLWVAKLRPQGSSTGVGG